MELLAAVALFLAGLQTATTKSAPPEPNVQADKEMPRFSKVGKYAYIREKPSGASRSLARLDEGERVRVIAEAENNYWEVQFGDVHGFVHELMLPEVVPDVPTLPPIPADEFGAGAYRMSSGIARPRLIRQTRPSYTDEALTKRVEGEVLLEVIIQTDGKIGALRVVHGLDAGLTEKAIECVRQWEFAPGSLEGRPVDIVAEIAVEFAVFEEPRRR